MQRQILIAVLPELALLAVAVAAAWLLLRLAHGRFDWRHAARLASDQRGAVQSLSFVLTVPLFVMVMMFIVQLSQLTIAKVVVEQAAVASARSAQVWIPADLTALGEGAENHLPCFQPIGELVGTDGLRYSRYLIPQAGLKYAKIRQAAVQTVVPICPSRATGVPLTAGGQQIAQSLLAATYSYAPGLAGNTMVPARLMNKLAYAQGNTEVVIEVRHKENEPPFQTYLIGPYLEEFGCGEVGWQDQFVVTVTHNFALLPGPGRLLARRVSGASGSTGGGSTGGTGTGYGLGSTASAPSGPSYGSSIDPVADRIQSRNGVYVYALQATARVYNEGQKPRLGYRQSRVGSGVAANPVPTVPGTPVRSPAADGWTSAPLASAWRPTPDEEAALATHRGFQRIQGSVASSPRTSQAQGDELVDGVRTDAVEARPLEGGNGQPRFQPIADPWGDVAEDARTFRALNASTSSASPSTSAPTSPSTPASPSTMLERLPGKSVLRRKSP
ncbi:MAG: hypothetical protein RLY70_112 [Planctomycetota bacterium]